MADALTIDFALTGQNKVADALKGFATLSDRADRSLQSLARSADRAAQAVQRLNMQMAANARLGGGAGGGGFSGAFGGGMARRPAGFAAGPYQRQIALQSQLAAAQGAGNRPAQLDIQLAQARNNKQLAGLAGGGKGVGGRFMDLVNTSRFSLSGGAVMPLVGKAVGVAAEALGPELAAIAGPVGLVVAGLVAAGKAAFDFEKSAADAAREFSARGFSMGNIGAGGAIASAIAGPNAASLANSLQQGITGSGMGRAAGLRLGVMNLGGQYGNTDLAGQLITAIGNLRNIKDIGERTRVANLAGLSGALPSTLMSDKQFRIAGQQGAVQSKIFDPAYQQQAADFGQALSGLGDAFGNLFAALAKGGLMDKMTDFFNELADTVNKAALWLNGPGGIAVTRGLRILFDTLEAGFDASPVGMLMGRAGKGASAAKDAWETANGLHDMRSGALDKNTDALNKLTGKIPGVYGNDTDGRLGRAFPQVAGYGGDNNAMYLSRRAFVSGSIRLGNF